MFVLLFEFLMYNLWKKRKEMMDGVDEAFEVSIDDEFEQEFGPKKFAYTDLKQATNNFAQEDKLGEGGFSSVYKVFLKGTNLFVGVNMVSSCSKQGIK